MASRQPDLPDIHYTMRLSVPSTNVNPEAPSVALILPYPLDPKVGGVQRSTWELGHCLARRGWEVTYVSLAPSGHRQPELGQLVKPAHLLPGQMSAVRDFLRPVIAERRPTAVVNQIAMSMPIADALAELRREGARFGVVGCYRLNPAMYRDNHRHILAHQLRDRPILRGLAASPLGARMALHLHRLRNRPRFRDAIERCDRFMLLSPTFFDELAWYVPDVDEQRLVAIPNGFPPPAITNGALRRNRLLYVGRMENAQKNIFVIPEIWARLQNRLPDWELHLVGDGEDRSELERRVAAHRLERVYFHGRMDPDEHYRAARMFLMLSTYEGFGNTLIEAQMHGVVPIAFDSYSAIRWMLNHDRDALLVPPFDLDAFSEAICSLATDRDRIEAMSVAAISNAARFSDVALGDRWEAALHDAICRAHKA